MYLDNCSTHVIISNHCSVTVKADKSSAGRQGCESNANGHVECCHGNNELETVQNNHLGHVRPHAAAVPRWCYCMWKRLRLKAEETKGQPSRGFTSIISANAVFPSVKMSHFCSAAHMACCWSETGLILFAELDLGMICVTQLQQKKMFGSHSIYH